MAARLGVKIAFRKIAVKAFDEPRPYPITRSLMTTDWQEVVNDPDIHIIIELVGGTGIGYFVWNEWNNLSIVNVINAILLIGVVGMVLDQLLARAAKLVTFPE